MKKLMSRVIHAQVSVIATPILSKEQHAGFSCHTQGWGRRQGQGSLEVILLLA